MSGDKALLPPLTSVVWALDRLIAADPQCANHEHYKRLEAWMLARAEVLIQPHRLPPPTSEDEG